MSFISKSSAVICCGMETGLRGVLALTDALVVLALVAFTGLAESLALAAATQ